MRITSKLGPLGITVPALCVLAAGAAVVFAAGTVTLPDAAKKTVERFGNGGKIERVVQENEDGLQVLTVTLNEGGKKMEVQTTLVGELNATEEKVAPQELPPQVLLAAQKRFPKGLTSAERAVVVLYEVEGRDAAGRVHEVRITLPGVVLLEAAAAPTGKEKDANDARK